MAGSVTEGLSYNESNGGRSGVRRGITRVHRGVTGVHRGVMGK